MKRCSLQKPGKEVQETDGRRCCWGCSWRHTLGRGRSLLEEILRDCRSSERLQSRDDPELLQSMLELTAENYESGN